MRAIIAEQRERRTRKDVNTHQKPTSLLEALRTVLICARNSALSDDYFKEVKIPMKYLCGRLPFTPKQITLLAIIMEKSCQIRVDISDLSNFLNISNLEVLTLNSDLNELVKQRYVVEEKSTGGNSFDVPQEVFNAFRNNEVYTFAMPHFNTDEELAGHIDKMICALDGNRMDGYYTSFDKDVHELLTANSHLHLGNVLLDIHKKTEPQEFRVALLMSMFWIRDEESEIEDNRFSIMFARRFELMQLTNQMQCGTSALIKRKIVEQTSSEGLLSKGVYSLTPKIRKSLTPKRVTKKKGVSSEKLCLISHTNIKKKEMYYNPDAVDQIRQLQQLLQPDQMAEILARMDEKGLRGGFTCLLFGGPGTGKTETVLQLARDCGRDIFQVDVSKLRSKWYGESERLVKNVFDEYRQMVNRSKVAPIMFFNEADAIFNRRMENAERSVDKSENALQNIILQEMETLKGILIATTNLQKNLDSAFERRFLYKIQLDKPTQEVKARIWQSMLPDLQEHEAQILAEQFDFSGGQIENIVRKRFINEVLTGNTGGLEALQNLCRNELLEDVPHKQQIGFMHRAS